MLKRINKVTSVLVATVAVTSLIPSISAYATTALSSNKGTLDYVHAFANGKYVYDGYKKDTDDIGYYLFDGSSDKAISSLEKISVAGEKYGKNYISYKDGSKEQLLNINTGTCESNTETDKFETMKVNLQSMVNKAERYRYAKNLTIDTNRISSDQFVDVWYKAITNDGAADTQAYTLFVNTDGKYIDASYKINIAHYTPGSSAKVNLQVPNDLKDDGYNISSGNVLFADDNYIYRTVIITSKTNTADTSVYLQKISKAQGEIKDDAFLPQTVESYYIGNGVSESDINPSNTLKVRVKGNSIYTIDTSVSSKITVKKYDLKNDKDHNNRTAVILDTDYNDMQSKDMTAYDIDINENIWVIYQGTIKKVVDGKLQDLYTVDTGMNRLSVYDDNNLIAWDINNNYYATVTGTAQSTNTGANTATGNVGTTGTTAANTTTGTVTNTIPVTTPVVTPPTVKAGWNKNTDGSWNYLNSDGSKVTGWKQDGSTWYYFNSTGTMVTGWVQDGSAWYYLNNSGAMATGWVQSGSSWYYLKSSGTMATGWLNDNGSWYYLDTNGTMLCNTKIDGYTLGANGAWVG